MLHATMKRTSLVVPLGLLAQSLAGQACPLHVDRVKPNGMFEFHVIVRNPTDAPLRLTALHVTYTTLTGAHYVRERRDVVSPFGREHVVLQPHQRVMLTTLPMMDAISLDDPATAFATCARLPQAAGEERVGS
jgi:hypothetical protein